MQNEGDFFLLLWERKPILPKQNETRKKSSNKKEHSKYLLVINCKCACFYLIDSLLLIKLLHN